MDRRFALLVEIPDDVVDQDFVVRIAPARHKLEDQLQKDFGLLSVNVGCLNTKGCLNAIATSHPYPTALLLHTTTYHSVEKSAPFRRLISWNLVYNWSGNEDEFMKRVADVARDMLKKSF